MSGALLHRRRIWDGRIVHLSVDRVRFPDGREGELEFIRHAGAAAVVPFVDPPTDPDPRILLIHQYRYAAAGHILEVPAGMPDGPGEPWDVCALRELEEETGRRAGALRYLTRILTTPGFTNEEIHLFAAGDLQRGEIQPDHDEYIQVVEIRFSEAMERVRTGAIVDAKSVSVLLYLRAFLPGPWDEDRPPPPRAHASG